MTETYSPIDHLIHRLKVHHTYKRFKKGKDLEFVACEVIQHTLGCTADRDKSYKLIAFDRAKNLIALQFRNDTYVLYINVSRQNNTTYVQFTKYDYRTQEKVGDISLKTTDALIYYVAFWQFIRETSRFTKDKSENITLTIQLKERLIQKPYCFY